VYCDPKLQCVAPIVKMSSHGTEILGTAFFVTTCGTMFTAGHVAKQWDGPSRECVAHSLINPSARSRGTARCRGGGTFRDS